MSKAVYMFVAGIMMLTACSGNLSGPTETPTPNKTQTAVAFAVQETETEVAVKATRAVETAEYEAKGTATQAAYIESLYNRAPQTATAQVKIAAPVMDFLASGGYIPSTEGIFLKLDNYYREFGIRDFFQQYQTNRRPYNFVMHSIVTLDTQEENVTTVSGCGFNFRTTDTNSGNYILFDFRGDMRYGVLDPDYWLAHGKVNNVVEDPNISFEIWLVVYESRYYVFVNGEEIFSQTALEHTGKLWYLISAGAEPMNCSYEDVWLWSLNE